MRPFFGRELPLSGNRQIEGMCDVGASSPALDPAYQERYLRCATMQRLL